MWQKLTVAGILITVTLLVGGCTNNITDTSTDTRIPALKKIDPTLTEIIVKTNGMLSDLGYDNRHPLQVNEKVLADMSYYAENPIARGDIVVFQTKNDAEQETDIARVVGLPGETVRIKKGQVIINDVELDAFYGHDSSFENNDSWDAIRLKNDEYYILADVRWRGFHDSQTAGAFSKDDLMGKIVGYEQNRGLLEHHTTK